jgi:fused signal recognition particle receptor
VDMTYILIGLALLVGIGVIYYVFIRKPEAPALAAPEQPKKAEERKPAKPAPSERADKTSDAPAEKPAAKKDRPAEKPDADRPRTSEKPAKPEPVASERPPAPERIPSAPPRAASAEGTSKPPPGPISRQAAPTRKRDVEGLRKGLAKSREKEGFFGRLQALFTGKKEIDPQIVEQMEEVLLTSDVGVKTTALLLDQIKSQLSRNELADSDKVWDALRSHATSILDIGGGGIAISAKPTVVMVVGVNGVGKTTTIGKLATKLKGDGKTVVLAAGDTFRAAAVEQLKVWGKRANVEVVAGKDGANPGAVIFDAIQRAKEIGAEIVLADTAGRLHTKTNLMEELTKVARTMTKAMDGAPHETLLVLDATNGQNAIQQAAMFKESLPLSGIVLTKLDGTAKGGVILAICAEHKVPVRYIGIGERAEDLRDFVPDEFVEALLG